MSPKEERNEVLMPALKWSTLALEIANIPIVSPSTNGIKAMDFTSDASLPYKKSNCCVLKRPQIACLCVKNLPKLLTISMPSEIDY